MAENDPTKPLSDGDVPLGNLEDLARDETSQRLEIRQNILDSIGSDQESIVVAEVLSHFPELADRFIRTQEWLRQRDSRDQDSRKIRYDFHDGGWSKNWSSADVTLPYHPSTILHINQFHNEFRGLQTGSVTNIYRLPLRWDKSRIDQIQNLLDPDSYYVPYDARNPTSALAEPSRRIIQLTLETLEVGEELLEKWLTYLSTLEKEIELLRELEKLKNQIKQVESVLLNQSVYSLYVRTLLVTNRNELIGKLSETEEAYKAISAQLLSYLPEEKAKE